jgi:DNA-binding Xre family transcriptional regulator
MSQSVDPWSLGPSDHVRQRSGPVPTPLAEKPQNAGRVLPKSWPVPKKSGLPGALVVRQGRGMAVNTEQRRRRRELVARNVRRMLDEQGRSAYWLARQIGVADRHMSAYLNAKHEPLNYLEEIADALDCSVADLYRENGA